MTAFDAVVVPSTPALLPQYAGLEDPVAELRSACRDAVGWLVQRHPERVAVVTGEPVPQNLTRGVVLPAGVRVARHLLSVAGFGGEVAGVAADEAGVLVVANGTAKRSAGAPGHLDERALAFDDSIGAALRDGDGAVLRELDRHLGTELWSYDVPALQALGAAVGGPVTAEVSYADDPYGVQYWVARWSCAS